MVLRGARVVVVCMYRMQYMTVYDDSYNNTMQYYSYIAMLALTIPDTVYPLPISTTHTPLYIHSYHA